MLITFFSFSFWKIPPIEAWHSKQVPGLLYRPTLQSDQGLTGSGSISAQLFPASVHSLSECTPPCVFATSSLFPPCKFKHPGPSRCWSKLVWQGRELLTWLSPKNLATDPAGAGPRDLIVLKHCPYHLIFQCPLEFWPPIFIYAGIPLTVHSDPQKIG